MRTKTLILAAAFSAVGIASSMAQVYSQNAVGYYNIDTVQGFNLIANQFNNGNNQISTIFPVVPEGSEVLIWNSASLAGGGQQFLDAVFFSSALGGWVTFDAGGELVPSTAVIAPGSGVFFNSPEATTITMVGEVPQGTLTVIIPPALSLVSQATPQALAVNDPDNLLPANEGDEILFWDLGPQSYKPAIGYATVFGGWFSIDGDGNIVAETPTPLVGEAFFYNSNGSGDVSWTRTFDVN